MIYVFDLDGTLCHTTGADYANAVPITDRIEAVNRLYDEGHAIIIETARGSVSGDDYAVLTERQLERWGVKRHQVRTGQKIYGDCYVDDKGVNAEDFFARTHD